MSGAPSAPWWSDEGAVGRTAGGVVLPELLFSDLDTRRTLRATEINATALAELAERTGSPAYDPAAARAAAQERSARDLDMLGAGVGAALGDAPSAGVVVEEARRVARLARGVPPAEVGPSDPGALGLLQAMTAAQDDPTRALDVLESYLDMAEESLPPARRAVLRLGVDRARDAQRELVSRQQESLPTSAARRTAQPLRNALVGCVEALCGRTQVANMVAATVDPEVVGSGSVGLPEGVLPAGMAELANGAMTRLGEIRQGRATPGDAVALEQVLQELSDWTGELSVAQGVDGAFELPDMQRRRARLGEAQSARVAHHRTRFDPAATAADRDAARERYLDAVQELYAGTLPVTVTDDGSVAFAAIPLSVADGIAVDPDRVGRVDALRQRLTTQPLDLLGGVAGRTPPGSPVSALLAPRRTAAGEVVASASVGGTEPSEPVTQPIVRPGLVAQREIGRMIADPDLFRPRIDLATDRFLDPADVARLDVVDALSIVEDVNERPRLAAQAFQALRQEPLRTLLESGADVRYVFREPLGRTFVSMVENGAKATVGVLGGGPAGQVVLRPFNENLFKPAAEELVRPADPGIIADASTAELFRADVPRPGVQDVTGRPFGFTLGRLQRPDGFPLGAGQPPLVAADGSVLRAPTRLRSMLRQGQRALVGGVADLVLASPVPLPGEDLVLAMQQDLDAPTLLGPDGRPLAHPTGGGPGRVALLDGRNRPLGPRPAGGRVFVPAEFVVDPAVRAVYTDRRAPLSEVAEVFGLPTPRELIPSLPADLVTSTRAVDDIRGTAAVNSAIRDLVPDEIRNTDWRISSAPRVTPAQRLAGLRPRALPGTVRGALTTSGPGMTANAVRRGAQTVVQGVLPQDGFLTRLCSDAITGCLRFGEVRLRQALAGQRADNRAARVDATDGFTDYTTGNLLLSGLEALTPGSGGSGPAGVAAGDLGGVLAAGGLGLTSRLTAPAPTAPRGPVLPPDEPVRRSVGALDVPEPGGAAGLPPQLRVAQAEPPGPVVLDLGVAAVTDPWTGDGGAPAGTALPDLVAPVTDPFDPDRPILDGLPVPDPTVAFDPAAEAYTPTAGGEGVLVEVPARRVAPAGGAAPATVVDVAATEVSTPLLPGGAERASAGSGGTAAAEPDPLRPVPFDPSADPMRPAGRTAGGDLVEVPVVPTAGDRRALAAPSGPVTVDVPTRPVGRVGSGIDLTDLGRGAAGLGAELVLTAGSEAVLRPYLVDQGVLRPTADEELLAGLLEGRTAAAPPVESTTDTVLFRTFSGIGAAGVSGTITGGPAVGGVSALASVPLSLLTAADHTLPGSTARRDAVGDLTRQAYLGLPRPVRDVIGGAADAVVGAADAVTGGAASEALAAADVADIAMRMRVAEQARRTEEFTAARGTPLDLRGASVERIALAYQYSGLAAVDETRAALAGPPVPSVADLAPAPEPPARPGVRQAVAPFADRAGRNAESLRRSGHPLCSDATEIDCVAEETVDFDDPASVGALRRGSGGIRSTDPATGRVREYPLCTSPAQVDCVPEETVDRSNPNSVGSVRRGDGSATFTDGAGRRVQYPDCSVLGQTGCVRPGTNELQVGTGRPTTLDEQGRTVEVVTVEDLRERAGSLTAEDYREAWQRRYTAPDGRQIPLDSAGRPSPALTDPVRQMVDEGRQRLGGAAEWLGDQAERIPVLGDWVDRWRGEGDDPDRGVVDRGGGR